jgi:hypothetical protein
MHYPHLAAVLSLRALKISYNHRMTYLVPFILTFKPGEEVPPPVFFEPDEPDIPPGPYQLQELYCPTPDCPCLEAVLQIFTDASDYPLASIRINLDPAEKPNPRLSLYDGPVPYAQALFKDIAQDLNNSPAYLSRLRAHYDHVKAVAADPSHPAHAQVIQWGKTADQKTPADKRKRKLPIEAVTGRVSGAQQPPAKNKRKRKRH